MMVKVWSRPVKKYDRVLVPATTENRVALVSKDPRSRQLRWLGRDRIVVEDKLAEGGSIELRKVPAHHRVPGFVNLRRNAMPGRRMRISHIQAGADRLRQGVEGIFIRLEHMRLLPVVNAKRA